MPRVPVHDLDTAPETAHNTLAALKNRYGRILNIHGEMAHVPVVLAAYTGIQAAIAEHGFDVRTREATALAVGAADDCSYCAADGFAAIPWNLIVWAVPGTVIGAVIGTGLQGKVSQQVTRWFFGVLFLAIGVRCCSYRL